MPCRDTGHHFSALGCGQATKIVMRRGGGPELCVDEVSGVEDRQVVSPPQDERLVGQVSAPHPAGVCPAELSQGERPAERVSIFPSSRGWSCASAASLARRSAFLSGRGPIRQGSVPQSSHRATFSRAGLPAPSHPVGGFRVGRTFSRAGLPGASEHPCPGTSWLADENLDNFGVGAVN